jgi:hypothetical protein
MKDGFPSISLADRKAPSVGFVRLVVGVRKEMLRLFDHESKRGRWPSTIRRCYRHEKLGCGAWKVSSLVL